MWRKWPRRRKRRSRRNRGGGGSNSHSRGGGNQKKSSTDSESGDKTASLECYLCLEPHRPSECPNRSASATVPATPNSQQGGFLGIVRTILGAGLLVTTSARPAMAARGPPRERHENEYWVADSGATENTTQDSSHLEDYTPAHPGDEVESAGGVFPPVVGYGRVRLLVDQDNSTFKGATRDLTLARVAHVPRARAPYPAFHKTTHNSVRRADARLPSRRHHSTPFRPQAARFPLSSPKNWLPRNQGPPSRRYEGAANAANGSAIDGDSQGDQNPSTSWRHAGPSASCSVSTLTTRDEPSASATSPPAKSSCVRLLCGTPQPTPERQFPVTRRLRGGEARHGHYSPLPKKTTHYTSSLASLEDVSKEPESEQHQPERAGESEGSFELERVEHQTGGGFGAGGGNFGRARTVKTASARAGLLWSKTFSAELAAKGFEQCQTDPCVFRRVLRGKVVVIIVVYVDGKLVASETKRDEERLIASLTATRRSGVRFGAGAVFTPHRLQCGMLNLE